MCHELEAEAIPSEINFIDAQLRLEKLSKRIKEEEERERIEHACERAVSRYERAVRLLDYKDYEEATRLLSRIDDDLKAEPEVYCAFIEIEDKFEETLELAKQKRDGERHIRETAKNAEYCIVDAEHKLKDGHYEQSAARIEQAIRSIESLPLSHPLRSNLTDLVKKRSAVSRLQEKAKIQKELSELGERLNSLDRERRKRRSLAILQSERKLYRKRQDCWFNAASRIVLCFFGSIALVLATVVITELNPTLEPVEYAATYFYCFCFLGMLLLPLAFHFEKNNRLAADRMDAEIKKLNFINDDANNNEQKLMDVELELASIRNQCKELLKQQQNI